MLGARAALCSSGWISSRLAAAAAHPRDCRRAGWPCSLWPVADHDRVDMSVAAAASPLDLAGPARPRRAASNARGPATARVPPTSRSSALIVGNRRRCHGVVNGRDGSPLPGSPRQATSPARGHEPSPNRAEEQQRIREDRTRKPASSPTSISAVPLIERRLALRYATTGGLRWPLTAHRSPVTGHRERVAPS